MDVRRQTPVCSTRVCSAANDRRASKHSQPAAAVQEQTGGCIERTSQHWTTHDRPESGMLRFGYLKPAPLGYRRPRGQTASKRCKQGNASLQRGRCRCLLRELGCNHDGIPHPVSNLDTRSTPWCLSVRFSAKRTSGCKLIQTVEVVATSSYGKSTQPAIDLYRL